VKRDLGVDERRKLHRGTCIPSTGGLPHEMNVAIINTYRELRKNLPEDLPASGTRFIRLLKEVSPSMTTNGNI